MSPRGAADSATDAVVYGEVVASDAGVEEAGDLAVCRLLARRDAGWPSYRIVGVVFLLIGALVFAGAVGLVYVREFREPVACAHLGRPEPEA